MMVAAKKGEVPAIGRFFMEVEIGRYPNIEAIEQAIISSGKSIDYASEVREIGISPVRKKVSLWEVCSIELGFHEKAPRSEIYEKAFDAGLKETTMEAVLLARIGCADKVWRIGGTQPVVYHKHHTCLLSLGSMFGKLFWLSTVNDGGPDYLYGPYRKWLFEK